MEKEEKEELGNVEKTNEAMKRRRKMKRRSEIGKKKRKNAFNVENHFSELCHKILWLKLDPFNGK